MIDTSILETVLSYFELYETFELLRIYICL
jgi:hypothetical protein